ncbi:uncharacterized protein STEHIDRAFT_162568 [Stereum hirsutum FP-91666 SS1]|uniref:uncharacterized protein n=1 Tax=Stereum hirsutum (strain FP-91666) TaxID=721885 RepID=UPI0004449D00|nr:uncharacterized protein STEHIDRAFT_162568 [Stereum hirsutum FP-91666 SS1]EIM80801.1 hypothetical protein STEHIDRAFT_162568 [Stereum hirsutum FP-91666 SS1]
MRQPWKIPTSYALSNELAISLWRLFTELPAKTPRNNNVNVPLSAALEQWFPSTTIITQTSDINIGTLFNSQSSSYTYKANLYNPPLGHRMSRRFLAPELVTYILEWVLCQPDTQRIHAEVSTLRSCTLVSKDWTAPAQRLLFHRVTTRVNVFSQKSIPDLDRFLTHQRGIGNRILSLDLGVRISPPNKKPRPGTPAFPVTSLEQILSNCPHLYHLGLRINISSFEEDEVARLSALSLNIRSLDVVFYCEMLESITQLFFIWPTIRHFSYRNSCKNKVVDLPAIPSERPPIALYELVLHSHLYKRVLDWLLPPPNSKETDFRPSLRILEMSIPELFEGNHWHYGPYAPFVQSLRLSDTPQINNLAGSLRSFENLEELVLKDCFQMWWTFDYLPPTLRHYRYHNSSNVWRESRGISTGRWVLKQCPELETFTSNHGASGLYADVYEDLKRECAKKNVTFNVDPRIHFTSDYPVPVDKFTRLRTLDNLYQMKKSRPLVTSTDQNSMVY